MKNMKIMKFKYWLKLFDLRESLKDSELNRILDKISDGLGLTSTEQNFLKKFDKIDDDDLRDLTHLSKENTYQKIKELLSSGKRIICDLFDRNGKIGIYIHSVNVNYSDDICMLFLKNGEKIELTDNYLYNLIYNIQKDEYSLEIQDEYYEKIPNDKN